MPKSLYNIYPFSYFAICLVLMGLFKLYWLIVEYIFFWNITLFIALISLEKLLPYALATSSEKFTTFVIIKMIWTMIWYDYNSVDRISWTHVCNANCPSSCLFSLWNVSYLCKYFFTICLSTYTRMIRMGSIIKYLFLPFLANWINVDHLPLSIPLIDNFAKTRLGDFIFWMQNGFDKKNCSLESNDFKPKFYIGSKLRQNNLWELYIVQSLSLGAHLSLNGQGQQLHCHLLEWGLLEKIFDPGNGEIGLRDLVLVWERYIHNACKKRKQV